MPKSSIEKPNPSARNSFMVSSTRAGSVMRALSVISSFMFRASASLAARMSLRELGNRGSSRLRIETLTATGIEMPDPRQATSCRAASSTRPAVSGLINPMRSATGMNSTGGIQPRCA